MARRHGYHAEYENAFEELLREHGVLYLAINEERKPIYKGQPIKNFDFIVSSFNGKFLVDVKGKELLYLSNGEPRWDNWVKEDDLSGLMEWSTHFVGFTALLVVPYLVDPSREQPKFVDEFTYHSQRYCFVALELQKYYTNAVPRGKVFTAVYVPRQRFSELYRPLSEFIPELRKRWGSTAN